MRRREILIAAGVAAATGAASAAGVVALHQLPGPVEASADPSASHVVPHLAALKALRVRPQVVTTQGYSHANDGGGGPPWSWAPGSAAPPDDFLVVQPIAGPPGRYTRIIQHGAAVSPKWAGAGLGAADDTARMNVVLAAKGGHAVDISGCTIPGTAFRIESTASCPGIFSDGSGTITCAPGTTAGTHLTQVYKSNFHVDRVRFVGPISTNPLVGPDCGKLLVFMGPVAETSQQRVSNCRFIGASTAFQLNNANGNGYVWFTDNLVSNTWGDATVCQVPKQLVFNGNMFHTCGYTPAGTDSVCHFTTQFSTTPSENLIITNNVVKDCIFGNSSFRQEAMDFAGLYVRNVVIANNIIDGVDYGGFEFKPPNTGVLPNFYGNVLIANNIVNFKRQPTLTITAITNANPGRVTTSSPHGYLTNYRVLIKNVGGMIQINDRCFIITVTSPTEFTIGADTSAYGVYAAGGNALFATGIGVALNNNGAPDHGMLRFKITGNYFLCDGDGASGVTGVTVGPQDFVTIDGNTFENIAVGVAVNGDPPARNLTMSNNVIDVNDAGIIVPSRFAVRLRITGNNVTAANEAIRCNGAAITDLFIAHNTLVTTNATRGCVDLRNTQTGRISHNTIVGNGVGITFGGVACTNVRVTENDIYSAGGNAVVVNTGTGISIVNNVCDIPAANRIVSGRGRHVSFNNSRGVAAADPTGRLAGSIGDIVWNSAPAAGGVRGWVCTAAGDIGVAVYRGLPANP